MWNRGKPYLLTSATLSVGGDFSRYMHQTGFDLLNQKLILTVSKTTPYDYWNRDILYVPEAMRLPNTMKIAYR